MDLLRCTSSPEGNAFQIAIVGEALAGFGDFASAEKIQGFLQESLEGQVQKENIKVYMDAPEKIQRVFKEVTFHPISDLQKDKPNLLVVFPGKEDFNEECQRNLREKIPTIYWNEYGNQSLPKFGKSEPHLKYAIPQSYINAGLRVNCETVEDLFPSGGDGGEIVLRNPEEGVFFDEELVDWSDRPKTSEERLKALTSASSGLQKSILVDQNGEEVSVEDFSQKSRLFFGYTNEEELKSHKGEIGAPTAVTFLIGLSEMQRKMVRIPSSFEDFEETKGAEEDVPAAEDISSKDMTVFLMGEHDLLAESEYGSRPSSPAEKKLGHKPTRQVECSHSSLMQAHVQRELLENGITHLEVYHYDKNLGTFSSGKILDLQGLHPEVEPKVPMEDRRSMKVITGRIDHSDSIALTKASEDEVVATGDGSLTEMLSARKSLIYQVYPHKQGIADGLEEVFPDIYLQELGTDRRYDTNTSFEDDFMPTGESQGKSVASGKASPGEVFFQRRMHKEAHRRQYDQLIERFDLRKNVAGKIQKIVSQAICGGLPPMY